MDYKISQLPSAFKVYDHDLLVAVTGYNIQGSYPDNVKISLDQIRKDIIRLNEMIFLLSGFSGYYNSGNNTMTITSHQNAANLIRIDYGTQYPYIQILSTTGLNAVAGNNIEVQFTSGTPAAQKYGKVGSPYYSGIISITGVNFRTENLITKDIEGTWPYSGIIYNTGLNARAGNNIDIEYLASGSANNIYGGAGGKYKSGIISTTGLNINIGSGIGWEVDSIWPYRYSISNMEKTKVGTSTTIANTGSGLIANSGMINLLNLSYNDLYYSHKNKTLQFLATAAFRITDIVFDAPPYVPSSGDTNTRKNQELNSIIGLNYTYSYNVCKGGGQYNYDTITATKIFGTGDFLNFEPVSTSYVIDSFTLVIGITGGNSSNFISTIHTVPITFMNRNGPNSNQCSEIYRSGANPYIFNGINSIDPIIIQEPVSLYIDSSGITNQNTLGLCAKISNIKYVRNYRYFLVEDDDIPCNNTHSNIYYTFATTNTYSSTQASLLPLFIKSENIIG